MKNILILFMIFLFSAVLYAAEGDKNTMKDDICIIPLLSYSGLSLDERTINSSGGGIVVVAGDMEPAEEAETDNLQTALLYSYHTLDEKPGFSFPDNFHSIDFVLQRKKGAHQYFTLFKSYSDKPVSGGFHTFALVSGYGYEILRNRNHSLYLGGSAGISDFGVELPDGTPLYIMPLPFIHYEMNSELLDFSFDFTTSPMFEIVIAPESKIRLNGSCIITDLQLESLRDIKFDSSLEYRFFSADHPMGDFAGARIGFLGEDYSYDISGNNENSITVSWYSVYTALDFSLLEITAGYAFDGEERYSNDYTVDAGAGFYMKLQLAYMF